MTASLVNRLLGYPPEARLLILNADDFGMCSAINTAIQRTLQAGVVRSTSLMVPCPWSVQAIQYLQAHPGTPFGVHLTVVCDSDSYGWGPLTCREKVPTLVGRMGHFHRPDALSWLVQHARLDELEMEFRAQIEAVLATGLQPAHLDWHYLPDAGRPDIFDLLFRLARTYRLALRVTGQAMIEKMQVLGLPANEHDLLDSFRLDPLDKPAQIARLLHALPAGLSEWAVHPGLDTPELLALEPDGNHIRQTDHDFWCSRQAHDLIQAEGIILIDYRELQKIWKEIG